MKWILSFLILFCSSETWSMPSEFYAGAASVDITPPIGTPLGGTGGFPRRYRYLMDWFGQHPYADLFTPSEGVLDPLRSKALVMKKHDSQILFLSLDLVGITSELYETLKIELKEYGFDEIFISATHTHSGSGALSRSWLWEILAMDRFHQEVYDQFIRGVKKSIEFAKQSIEPAHLYSGSFDLEEIHRNRRNRPGHMDNSANLLIVKNIDETRTIGGIVNYAIHGMAMGGNGLLFSADVSGGIERHLESLFSKQDIQKPTFLFINGAEGDVTTVYGGSEGVEKAGSLFAQKAATILTSLRSVDPEWKIRKMSVKIPKARLNLAACGVEVNHRPVKIQIPIDPKAAPRIASIWQIQLGDITMMTFPGEPTTDIGMAAKSFATSKGIRHPWIFGLTNGHLAYLVTPEEYQEGGIEGCSALHGPKVAGMLLKSHETLLNSKSIRYPD